MVRLQLCLAPAPSFPCSIYQAGPHKYCRGRANNYFLYKRINFNYKEQLAFCNPDNLIASKSSTIIYPCDDHKIYSHMSTWPGIWNFRISLKSKLWVWAHNLCHAMQCFLCAICKWNVCWSHSVPWSQLRPPAHNGDHSATPLHSALFALHFNWCSNFVWGSSSIFLWWKANLTSNLWI